MSKIIPILFYLLSIVIGITYVGTVIELLQKFIGFLAYGLWIIAAPILSPTLLFLPWFDAWVTGHSINTRTLWLWGIWMTYALIVIVYFYFVEDLIKKLKSK